jgi:hypothetical protein
MDDKLAGRSAGREADLHETLQNDSRWVSIVREFLDTFLVLRRNFSGRHFVCPTATVAALFEISSVA